MATRTDSRSAFCLFATAALVPLVGASLSAQQDKPQAPAQVTPAVETQEERVEPPRYRWVEGFGRREDGKPIGSTHGCMCVDSKGRILANTDTEDAVVMFSPAGVVVGSWGKEYRGGLHGMTLRMEGSTEYLYLAHTMRGEVVKTTIDGEVVWTLGWPESSGIYASESEFHPTSVAVAGDGRMFVADGYGKSWIHAYDCNRKLIKSFGGPGREPGKLQTPHGLCIDTRGEKELLLVCDRENHRLQWFTLDGAFVRESREGMLRPCNIWPLDEGRMAVADLVGRVTILDAKDKPILVLGEGAPQDKLATNQVAPELWTKDRFFAPHSVCADREGNLFVMDWNVHGRISKLEFVR
jgi:hypothetical protein